MLKNVAGQHVSAYIVDASNAPVTTGTAAVHITVDGVRQVATGAATHIGGGEWGYAPAQAETDGAHVAYLFAHSSGVGAMVALHPRAGVEEKLDSMLSYDEEGEVYIFEGSYTSAEIASELRDSIAPELDALASITTDPRPELAAVPAADADLPAKVDWMFMLLRNKVSQTESAQALYADDGETVVASAAVSDTDDTTTRAEWAS